MPNQDQENKNTKQGAEKEAFSVSVMPKEFRGRDGLKREYVANPVVDRPQPQVRKVVEPVPKVVKKVTPAAVAKATLQQPIQRPKKKPIAIIVVGGVVIILLGVLVAVLMFGGNDDISLDTPTAPPAVVPTTPTAPVDSVESDIPDAPDIPEVADPFADDVLPGKDTDSDGLTDIEEVLYGTQYNRPDTDQDGFLDGNEVFNLFHPNGTAPQTLLDTGAVVVVSPEGSDYQIHRIVRWREQSLPAQNMYMITAPTGESFQVVEFDVSATESIQDFYNSNIAVEDRQELGELRTKQGFSGIWTEDHFSAYIRLSDNKVLVFTYNLGNAKRVEYRQTFEMFINSLTIEEIEQ